MPLLKVSLSKGHTDAPNVSTTFYLNSSNSIQTFGNRITVKKQWPTISSGCPMKLNIYRNKKKNRFKSIIKSSSGARILRAGVRSSARKLPQHLIVKFSLFSPHVAVKHRLSGTFQKKSVSVSLKQHVGFLYECVREHIPPLFQGCLLSVTCPGGLLQ